MPYSDLNANNPELLRHKLSLETALISWRELEVHYARGSVIQVSAELDLVEAGLQLIQDSKTQFEAWLADNLIHSPETTDAAAWHAQDAQVWALVIAPWVLIQVPPAKEQLH